MPNRPVQSDAATEERRGGEEGRGGEREEESRKKGLEGERVEEDLKGERRGRRRGGADGHTAAAIQTHPACETQLH